MKPDLAPRLLRGSILLAAALLVLGANRCPSQKDGGGATAPSGSSAPSAASSSDTSSAGGSGGPTTAADSKPLASALDLRTAIQDVARRTIPAVVHIEVTQHQDGMAPQLPFEGDPFFRYFFDAPQQPRKFRRELKGLGTGMIMDDQGHVLTNNHVVADASEIEVVLSDGRRSPGKVVGTDPKTDLAVLSIEDHAGLPHVSFGDSDRVEVGEWVVAIGHPRGLDETVTQGIVSAKHRTGIMDPSGYQDFLQTDAAINPGNSGGPLLDLSGDVIGVNAAIASQSGGYEGIGFAIPSNMALHVANALIAQGKVDRGWLGISVQDLTPALADQFERKDHSGALVADVLKGGPAERAGLERGDVIVTYRGERVPDSSALRNAVANTPADEKVAVGVWRKGAETTLEVTIGRLDDGARQMLGAIEERLGATLRPVETKERATYRLGTGIGIAIASVEAGGPLGEAGFEVDDVLVAIDGSPIEGGEGLVERMGALPHHQQVRIGVVDHRTGETGEVVVTIR